MKTTKKSLCVRLKDQAMKELKTRELECTIFEGDDAEDGDTVSRHYGLIIGNLDGRPQHDVYDSDEKPSDVRDEVMGKAFADFIPDVDSDIDALGGVLAGTHLQTIVMLVCTVNQRGEKSWLVYHHPNIDFTDAQSFLYYAGEASKRKLN